jgi:GAF domain-containing protein
VEVVPEVRAAALQLAALSEQTLDLVPALEQVAALAVAVLPSMAGVSITVLVDGDPFTVTATRPEIAAVDASQYLTDGPCLNALRTGEQTTVDDVLDEQRWQEYAQTASAYGIRSSLSVPLRGTDGGHLGALNLYASEPDAFAGSEERVAAVFGAHVEEVVRNADLSFMTLQAARELPQRLADHERVSQAIGVLMSGGMDPAEARERLEYAAGHARITLRHAADVVLILHT